MRNRGIPAALQECSRLLQIIDLEERYRQWLPLWQEYVKGGRSETTSIDIVDALTYVGCATAMGQEDYCTADDYINVYLAHPHFEQADAVNKAMLLAFKVVCLMHTGKEEQAAMWGLWSIQGEDKSAKGVALMLLREDLYKCLMQYDEDKLASKELTDLVWEIRQGFRRRPIRRQIKDQERYGRLCELLMASYPPDQREVARKTGEANRMLKHRN